MKKLGKIIIGIIGLIASIIGILVFLSGKESIQEFLSETGNSSSAIPPVDISGCSSVIECPGSIPLRTLFIQDTQYDYNAEYEASILPQDAIRFSTGWCAIDQDLLYDNLHHITYIFVIDGVSQIDKFKSQYSSTVDPDDAAITNYCYMIGAMVDGWKTSHTYRITFGYKTDTDIYDGETTLPKGDYLRSYIFTVK